ncbi:GNAT family N-acetyltransferase [Roseateles sp. NT4]|uniref:GNAT family N-acetyltransferase n=1 Tax=Roseateles sp. NT4 TaxID=3453715 RepID=UPI003EF015BD
MAKHKEGLIRVAKPADRGQICRLIRSCQLSTKNVLALGSIYWVHVLEDSPEVIVGVCGVEFGPGCALLRSVATLPNARRSGVASALVSLAFEFCQHNGMPDVYVLSKDTGAYFESLGWKPVPVPELATRLRGAPQVRAYEEIGWYPDEKAFLRRDDVEKHMRSAA